MSEGETASEEHMGGGGLVGEGRIGSWRGPRGVEMGACCRIEGREDHIEDDFFLDLPTF